MKEEEPNSSPTSPKIYSASVLLLAKKAWSPIKLEQVWEIASCDHLILNGSKSEPRRVKQLAQSHKASLQHQQPWPGVTTAWGEEENEVWALLQIWRMFAQIFSLSACEILNQHMK